MKTKQAIIIRSDLRNQNGQKIRTGKIAAQACHASMAALLSCFRKYKTSDDTTIYQTEFGANSVLNDWLNGLFTKVCVSVDSLDQLNAIYESVPDDIPKSIIKDAGLTEFNGVETITCACIGPWDSEEIDKFTGNLKLL